MEQEYANVLVRLVESGKTPKEAVAVLADVLKKRGRASLLPRIARAFERAASRALLRSQTRITVARAEDAHAAQKAAGVTDAHVTVDDSLIGGWRLEQGGILTDNSYKRHLLDIYHRAIRA